MSDYILSVPEEVYRRAQRLADSTSQSADVLMVEHLRSLSAALPALPPDEEAELEAIRHLSDDALVTIAHEQMPQAMQARMSELMGDILPALKREASIVNTSAKANLRLTLALIVR